MQTQYRLIKNFFFFPTQTFYPLSLQCKISYTNTVSHCSVLSNKPIAIAHSLFSNSSLYNLPRLYTPKPTCNVYPNKSTKTFPRRLNSNSFSSKTHSRALSSAAASVGSVESMASSPIKVCGTKQSHHQPITICVEGNIGSGKTTLLNHLAGRDGVEVFQEPVHKWRNVRGMNLLDLMYQDPVRWSHVFQTYVQLTMMQLHITPTKAKVKVMERSIYSARHCFVENLFQSGKMSEPEYNVYCEWFKMITSNLNVSVDLIVYLSASPSTVMQRIKQRGRTEEASIPMGYLSELDNLHRSWLYDKAGELPAPLLVLDTDMTQQQMCDTIQEHIDVIAAQRLSSTASQSTSSSTSSSRSVLVPLSTSAATAPHTIVPETAAAASN